MNVSVWMRAVRPFAFTATFIPVTLGAVLALSSGGRTRWDLFPLVLICSLFFHAGTNLINDYYDFINGIDKPHTFGSSGILCKRDLSPGQIRSAGWICFVSGFLLGLILVAVRGLPMFLLGLAGLTGGYFYTAGPLHYKYRGAGDILVFILMGPLMVAGSYFALTGGIHPGVIYSSFPVGCLVAAILHANNLRDIPSDQKAQVKTLASILGRRRSQILYVILIAAAYAGVLLMIVTRILPLRSTVVLLSLPVAGKNIKTILTAGGEDAAIVRLDQETAKLHLLFGTFMILSLVILPPA